MIKRVRSFVSIHNAIEIYKGLIEPHFNYFSAVWDGFYTQQLSDKLQILQNRAIRVITKSSYDTSFRFLLKVAQNSLNTYILMRRYSHSLSVDAGIKKLRNYW